MASKNYYCKGCGNNNHGWCPFLQSNSLKEISSCNLKTPECEKLDVCEENMSKHQYRRDGSYKSESSIKKTAPSSENVFHKEEKEVVNKEGYKVYGAREMFFFMQQQIQAMSQDDSLDKKTLDTVKQIMISLEKKLLIDEQCHGICTDYMTEQDIVKGSKMLSKAWFNEVGEYKEPLKEV